MSGEGRDAELDAILTEAGHPATAGYSATDGTVGWIVQAGRRITLTEVRRVAWLIAEVGIEGDGIYPEDDLAEDAGIDVPRDHVLWWDDSAERVMLAHRLGRSVSPGTVRDAISAFATLADNVERELVLNEDLGVEPSPPDGDLFERGYFRPPH